MRIVGSLDLLVNSLFYVKTMRCNNNNNDNNETAFNENIRATWHIRNQF